MVRGLGGIFASGLSFHFNDDLTKFHVDMPKASGQGLRVLLCWFPPLKIYSLGRKRKINLAESTLGVWLDLS